MRARREKGKFVNSISELTQLPTITLISVVFVLLVGLIFHATYDEKVVDFGPTILTTTGIFFTFLGIAIGLKEFDVSNIQASVPALLNGLKTAFWASVAGVGGALTLKVRYYAFGLPARKDGEPATGATVDDLAENLRSIHWALAGDSEATLVSQLKLMRQRLQRSPRCSKKSANRSASDVVSDGLRGFGRSAS